MAKRIKQLRQRVQEKTTEKEKQATRRRTEKKAKANKRRRRRRKLKKKVAKPVSEAKGLAGDVKDLTKAQAEALATRVPGTGSKGSPVSRRKRSGQAEQSKSEPDQQQTGEDADDALSERQQKVLLAQRLRNQGLTTQQVANQVGMSPSWVSSNTTAVDASDTLEASDDLEQSGDSFLSGIQEMEDKIFGGDIDGDGMAEGGVDIDLSGLDKDVDDQLSGIDDQFGDID